jgi:hypothetical protein
VGIILSLMEVLVCFDADPNQLVMI